MSPDADIVVAGAGHNSLLTACYLAKAGYSCLPLIAEPPGGGIWARRRLLSALEFVRHEFTSRHIQAFLLWMAFQVFQPVDVPGSGVLPYQQTFGRQQRSWSIPIGGSGRLTAAL